MSQHDLNIANQSFPNTRSDLNNALVALGTNLSGAAAPSTTHSFMSWCDSGNDIMKLRNEANSDWISLYKTDGVQQYASGSTAALPAFSKSDDVDTGLYFPSADNVALATGGTGRLYIDSSGNVGLNNATPSATLDVAGDMVVDTNTFKVDSANNRVGIGTATPSTTLDVNGATTITEDLTVDTTTLKVDSTNNRVGIGTASPTQTLDVRGKILTRSSEPNIYVDSTVTNTFRGLFLQENNNNKSGVFQYGSTHSSEANNLAIKNYVSSGDIGFYTNDTNRMTIDYNGTVSINRSAAGVGTGFSFSKTGSYHQFMSGTSNVYTMAFYRGLPGATTLVGSIITSGTSTSYNTSSDYRLKENVTTITDGLSRLMKLKPSRFNFISDKDKVVDGFLAHEAQEVVPESVCGIKDAIKDIGNITDKEGKVVEEKVEKPEDLKEDQKWEKTGEKEDYQVIDQAKLVPLLVASVQELKKEIDKLKNKK